MRLCVHPGDTLLMASTSPCPTIIRGGGDCDLGGTEKIARLQIHRLLDDCVPLKESSHDLQDERRRGELVEEWMLR